MPQTAIEKILKKAKLLLAFRKEVWYYNQAVRKDSENAPLAQLDRASGYGPEGQEFESLTACQRPHRKMRSFCILLYISPPQPIVA